MLIPVVNGPAKLHPWVTLGHGLLVTALLIFLFVLPRSNDPLSQLRFPAESASRMTERHLEFYEGYDKVPRWQQSLHTFLFGNKRHVTLQSIDVYREVLQHFQKHPDEATSWASFNIRARLLITLAENHHWDELEKELDALNRSLDEEMLRDTLLFAYTHRAEHIPVQDILYGARLVPLGWASDRLWLRLSEKLDYQKNLQSFNNLLETRGLERRQSLLLLVFVVVLVLILGTWIMIKGMNRSLNTPWYALTLQSPWSLHEGTAVILRAAGFGMLIWIALSVLSPSFFRPGIFAGCSTLFASIPMLWLIHHHLLKPRGLGLGDAFGFKLGNVASLITTTLFLLAILMGGTLLIGWIGYAAGLQAHWSDGLSEQVIFGPLTTVWLSSLNVVLWAPLFEEIGFRGLFYVTLRSCLGPRMAIFISALLFSTLHLYSLTGFLAVFWSGLVLAWAFERYRSLLPGILAHALANLLAISPVLMFYR